MKFTTLPTLLSATKEGFSVAKHVFNNTVYGRLNEFDNSRQHPSALSLP
jgi:hypothetical protein